MASNTVITHPTCCLVLSSVKQGSRIIWLRRSSVVAFLSSRSPSCPFRFDFGGSEVETIKKHVISKP